MTCAVVLWVLLGTPAGYVSARLYKSKGHIKTVFHFRGCRELLLTAFVILISVRGREVEDERVADRSALPWVS